MSDNPYKSPAAVMADFVPGDAIHPRNSIAIYRFAIACGAIPLILGISIFLLWIPTRWMWLPVAGLLNILFGLLLFLAGSVALLTYSVVALKSREIERRKVWLSIFLCAALLISNFPAAATIIWAVGEIEPQMIGADD